MATVTKGAKINFYKFVDPDGGAGTTAAAKGVSKENKALTASIKANTQAINNLGATVNSIGKVAVSMKNAQLKLLKIDEDRLRKSSFKPKFTKAKPIKSKAFDSLFSGKIMGFWESLLNLAGALLKYFLVLPALKWLSKEENQDKVVSGLKILAKVFKFIADVAKFSFVNTIEGLYDLLRDDATWQERIGGFVQALTGLGTGFLAISILTNPAGTIKQFANVLTMFNTGLKKAALKLLAHPLVIAAGGVALLSYAAYELIGKDLAEAREEADNTKREALKQAPSTKDLKPGEIEAIIEGSRIPDVGGSGSTNNLNNMFTDPLGLRNDPLGTGFNPNGMGLARGGYLQGYAKGGWINGPQSGYPVNISGGNKPDFIGHGTEYVARKADGGAFIVPFDTPATRTNPSLTASRTLEAKMMGFKLPGFSDGGALDSFAKRMIKVHEGLRLKKYLDSNDHPTIGYGHLVRPTDRFPDTISKAFAEQLFEKDYKHHKSAAKNIPGYSSSTPMQKAALIDLTFNMGPHWYKEFPKMMTAYGKGDFETAGNELMDSNYFRQVKRRGPTIVSLIKNKGLGPASQYLIDAGIIPPAASTKSGTSQNMNPLQAFGSFISNTLFGGPASAAPNASGSEPNDMGRDTANRQNTTTGSFTVIPTSHQETGAGWGIRGVTDKYGRPIVLSQPAAMAFAKMMQVSKGQVKGSDIASSGRTRRKNTSVGGDPNSVHLYGEGLDISGSSERWMKSNASRYGWNFGYNHGPGSGHYDYEGKGSRVTPILAPPGGKSFVYDKAAVTDVGASATAKKTGSGNIFTNLLKASLAGQGKSNRDPSSLFNESAMDTGFGSLFDVDSPLTSGINYSSAFKNPFSSTSAQRAESIQEQARIRKVTEQRNQARREINAKTSEVVQMALAAVEAQNGSNRQFIQTAESAIRNLLGAQAGGGTFANVGGTTGTVLRTAVAVLNSFNNPLRGIFQ